MMWIIFLTTQSTHSSFFHLFMQMNTGIWENRPVPLEIMVLALKSDHEHQQFLEALTNNLGTYKFYCLLWQRSTVSETTRLETHTRKGRTEKINEPTVMCYGREAFVLNHRQRILFTLHLFEGQLKSNKSQISTFILQPHLKSCVRYRLWP